METIGQLNDEEREMVNFAEDTESGSENDFHLHHGNHKENKYDLNKDNGTGGKRHSDIQRQELYKVQDMDISDVKDVKTVESGHEGAGSKLQETSGYYELSEKRDSVSVTNDEISLKEHEQCLAGDLNDKSSKDNVRSIDGHISTDVEEVFTEKLEENLNPKIKRSDRFSSFEHIELADNLTSEDSEEFKSFHSIETDQNDNTGNCEKQVKAKGQTNDSGNTKTDKAADVYKGTERILSEVRENKEREGNNERNTCECQTGIDSSDMMDINDSGADFEATDMSQSPDMSVFANAVECRKNDGDQEHIEKESWFKERAKSQGVMISLSEHRALLEQRRRSESAMCACERPTNNYRKHSSGDLHSRLKTRKLLGVGETDDGDVHRSKLSQILGHSDQLYIRLPSGLRLWQIVLAVVLTVLAVWALILPGHYFHAMYDIDGSTFAFPIRLYACALICISMIYWSTIQVADREIIRLILLSSIIFFALQSCVLMSSWLPWLHMSSPASFLCTVFIAFIARLLVIAISSYFYWITYKDGKAKDVKYYR